MISDFIYKYYIDPIRMGQPYNIVDTLTYALILVLGVYLLYRWMSQSTWLSDIGFKIDTRLYPCYAPLCRSRRTVACCAGYRDDYGKLPVSARDPAHLLCALFFTISMLFLSRYITLQGFTKNFLTFYTFAGILSAFVVLLVLFAWGINHAHVDLFILAIIPLMAVTATLLVWACMRYLLRWKYVNYSLYLVLIFGQLLDASATSYGIDLHPSVRYIEQHVVGSGLIELTHTAFVMFPLKLVVLFPAIYIMELYRKEANPAFWHLVLLAMIVVGLAPGIRDMMRMVLYV